MITELSVPGIDVQFLKRPYDLAMRLLVQDLCLVDRIQTFGPEYELVVCSSGRSLFGFSPTVHSPSRSVPTAGVSPPAPSPGSARHGLHNPSFTTGISAELLFQEIECSSSTGSLLGLCYTLIRPHSPLHPAMLEAEEGQGEGQGEGTVDWDMEPLIHRINVQCTAVDAIGIHI